MPARTLYQQYSAYAQLETLVPHLEHGSNGEAGGMEPSSYRHWLPKSQKLQRLMNLHFAPLRMNPTRQFERTKSKQSTMQVLRIRACTA